MKRYELDTVLDMVTPYGRTVKYLAKDTLFLQGEPTQQIGFVLAGKAKAVAYSQEGEETWLGHFQTGDFLGHVSFLTSLPVRYEVTAEIDMEILIIARSSLDKLLDDHIDISKVLAQDIAVRFDNMVSRLIEALTLSAKGRVCAELTRLSLPMGIAPEKHVIRPNPVFVDIALRINSTRETVSRTVSELQKKGILSRETGLILIHKPEALKAATK